MRDSAAHVDAKRAAMLSDAGKICARDFVSKYGADGLAAYLTTLRSICLEWQLTGEAHSPLSDVRAEEYSTTCCARAYPCPEDRVE